MFYFVNRKVRKMHVLTNKNVDFYGMEIPTQFDKLWRIVQLCHNKFKERACSSKQCKGIKGIYEVTSTSRSTE